MSTELGYITGKQEIIHSIGNKKVKYIDSSVFLTTF